MNDLFVSTSISVSPSESCSIEGGVVDSVDGRTCFGGKGFRKVDLRGSDFENIGGGKGGGERLTRPLALKT